MEWVTEKCEGKRGSGLSVIHALLIADIRFRCDDLLSNRKVKDTYTTNTTVLLSYNAQSSMYFIDANDVMCRSHCQLLSIPSTGSAGVTGVFGVPFREAYLSNMGIVRCPSGAAVALSCV